MSKIKAGRVRRETSSRPLSAVFAAVASIIAESALAKGLAVPTAVNAVPPWLRGDPIRCRQAVLNFARNAVKCTDSCSFALRADSPEDSGGDLLVRFLVKHAGVGIAAENNPPLFKPSKQADDGER